MASMASTINISSSSRAPTGPSTASTLQEAEPSSLVSLSGILEFVFVKKHLQHPQTTGRLLAYGLFGPLDADMKLRSGRGGAHVVQSWELNSMCAQFEREDLVQIYLPFGYAVSTLGQEEMQAIISQADTKLKSAKGKRLMPQVTEEEVCALFKHLRVTAAGLYSFHDIQGQILKWRVERIAKYKVTYPSNRSEKTSIELRDEELRDKLEREHADVVTDITPWGKRHFKNAKAYRVSAKVAPPTMFEKNKGMKDQQIPDQTNLLLCHKTYQIADLSNSHSSELSQNVRLLRDDDSKALCHRRNYKGWNDLCLFKDSQVGSHVKCARSSSTTKRHVTVV